MGYTLKREKKYIPATETNFLRPRYTRAEGQAGMNLAALIGVTAGREGNLCWGIVDEDGEFVVGNQQMKYDPWTGVKLPATLDELKKLIGS